MSDFEKYADPVDRAAQEQQLDVEIGIQKAKASLANGPELARKGTCWNCGEPIKGVFCDKDCEHDYERLKANQRVV